jgi:1,2-diacylglycerol 3-beta-galactosyltransferase
MLNLDLVYFDAGGGHRAAANALRGVIAAQRRPWTVRLVHLTRVLDPKESFRRVSGVAPEDLYNRRLARGWTIGLAQELKLLQAMIRLGHPTLVRALADHWAATGPDMVVSLVPNFNRALAESVEQARPGVPFVTVMTDLADLPPHFWIEPGTAQVVVCGTVRAAEQALAAGVPAGRVHRTSGMILRGEFYEPARPDRRAERIALGLDPDRPTGLVMDGGQGSRRMLRIARALDDVQLVFLCGHHAALVDALRATRRSAPHVALGFTSEVPRYMRVADFFVGKPGPGSLSEALHCGLPVVTFGNAWTMPQERYNVRWVRDLGLGVAVGSVRALPQAVSEVVEHLDAYRERVARLENRAVFEVPDILEGLLQPHPASVRPLRPVRRLRALAA